MSKQINMASRMRPEEYAHAKEVEDLCALIILEDNPDVIDVRRSSSREDMYLHYDLIVELSNKEIKVDVKGLKSLGYGRRKTGDFHWIELKNVSGAPGWLYGKADVFSFQVGEQEFIHVTQASLLDFTKGILQGIDTTLLRLDPYDLAENYCMKRIFTGYNPDVPDHLRRYDQRILVETKLLRKLASQPFRL